MNGEGATVATSGVERFFTSSTKNCNSNSSSSSSTSSSGRCHTTGPPLRRPPTDVDPVVMHPTINYKEKQAECPPIQMEPVDLSVNSRGGGHLLLTDTSSRRRSSRSPESRKRRSSPANGIIDLRVNKSEENAWPPCWADVTAIDAVGDRYKYRNWLEPLAAGHS
ncbi:hypothetical protein OUZ56_008303 [Daphnia magna]|uniref:Uncharacterized protein n=1 Tax=Daphnia magna TaxID=35525 RepID=A0ABR0ACN7_9CRUS|nr:hypothetical protein OUZ56_008303 [Daphnia magna]